MIVNMFPTSVGFWDLTLGAEFDRELYTTLMQINDKHSTGDEIWNRQSHDIFDGSVPIATQLADMVLPVLQRDFIGSRGSIVNLQGREVVRYLGTEIMPHSDEDECHLQAVYFPNGAEFDTSLILADQVNQYGPNGFAICNPDWRSSGFGAYLMPWETPAKFWIKPHRGLLIAYDARTVHFQKPYMGECPFMNILLNIKVQCLNDYSKIVIQENSF